MNIEFTLGIMNLMKTNVDMFVFNDAIQKSWKDLQIDVSNVVHFSRPVNRMRILTTVAMFFNEDPIKSRSMEICLSAEFMLENFEHLEKDGQIEFPHDFISILLGIMYSTVRGVVLDKLTLSSALVLPLVDPNELHREISIDPDGSNK